MERSIRAWTLAALVPIVAAGALVPTAVALRRTTGSAGQDADAPAVWALRTPTAAAAVPAHEGPLVIFVASSPADAELLRTILPEDGDGGRVVVSVAAWPDAPWAYVARASWLGEASFWPVGPFQSEAQ